MKTILAFILLAAVFSVVGIAAETSSNTGKLRHVVSLKFKTGTDADQIKKVEEAFRDLKNKIPGVAALEWGTNMSSEKHDKGFTHCFILTFKTEKDRDAYLPHPEHKKFGKILGPVLEDVLVIDYWAKD